MLGSIFTSKYFIGGGIVLLIILGGGAYVKISSDTIKELRAEVTTLGIQTKNLQAANDSLQTDMRDVQQAQQEANRKLDDIRYTAAQMARSLASQKFDTSNIKALQQQINKQTSDSISSLEQLSHDP